MESPQKTTDSYPLSLQEAIESKNYNYLEKYLVDEQNIYMREADGFTPLQIALQIDDIKMVRFLLQHKADPNQCYLYGNWKNASPLHFALATRSSAMAMLLIESGADIFASSPTTVPAICVVIMCNRVHIFHHLMKNGISPDILIDKNTSLLTYAVMKENIKIVKCILEHKPNVDLPQNQRAIVEAIYGSGYHSKRLVKMLYKYGFALQPADVHFELIIAAIAHGHCEVIRNLLNLGVNGNLNIFLNPETEASSVMVNYAAYFEEQEMLKLLLESGANLHTRDIYGNTPIMTAVLKNNLSIIRLLFKHGADVTDSDSRGRTLLHLALMENMENVHVNLNWRMNNIKTKIITLLIAKGADIHAKTNHRHFITDVIHYAAFTGIPGAVEVLLTHGARVDEVNFQDMTPLEWAKRQVEDLVSEVNVMNYPKDFGELKLTTFQLLQNHVHRLYRIGLPVCSVDLVKSSYESCQLNDVVNKSIDDEINYIKKTKIGDSYITLFRFLTCSDKKAAGFLRNGGVLGNLKAMLYEPNHFPEYAKLIRRKLTVALEKNDLNRRTFKLMNFFFREKNLPFLLDECTDHIISFLSDNDKKIVIDQFTKKLI